MSRQHPFAFDIDDTGVRADGMGMMNGTPAIPAYYAALPGLRSSVRSVSIASARSRRR